jgi:hypothetical protein
LLCRSKVEAKYLDKAAGHRQVTEQSEGYEQGEARDEASTKF